VLSIPDIVMFECLFIYLTFFWLAFSRLFPITLHYGDQEVVLNYVAEKCFFNKSSPSHNHNFYDDFSNDICATNFFVANDDCFHDLNSATHNIHKVQERKTLSPQRGNIPLLSGSTYWVDDYMAVGHAMYDISLLQLLRINWSHTHLERVVLQRAPCATQDLCLGIGSWESFYRQLYSIMLSSASTKQERVIPFYVRFNKEDAVFHAYFANHSLLTTSNGTEGIKELRVIKSYCFERLITRKCTDCFGESLSKEAVIDFKLTAYSSLFSPNIPIQVLKQLFQMNCINQTNLIHIPNIFQLFQDSPYIITVALREPGIRRYIKNSNLLFESLFEALSKTSFSSESASLADTPRSSFTMKRSHVEIRTLELNKNNLTAADQLRVMAESEVVIAGHGAFLSNLVYMRPGTMLIEIMGNYDPSNTINFIKLSRMFLVKHETVMAMGLTEHNQMEYVLSQNESATVAELARLHFSSLLS